MLGKRKRDVAVQRHTKDDSGDPSIPSSAQNGASDIFRKYFEAKFDPLPRSQLTTPSLQEAKDDSEDDSDLKSCSGKADSESEWSGIAEDVTQTPLVEVVDHTGKAQTHEDDPIGKLFQKSFMSSKPPRDTRDTAHVGGTPKSKDDDEIEEQTNLKHDLDLQRLLHESQLLEQNKKKSDGGAQRHKATDMRLQSLGSRASLFTQEKMPMSHRKGIQAKLSSKQAHRRREAKENGVILEKSSQKSSSSAYKRDRGVDVPVVGKFKGGTLQLTRRDVASIQGPRRTGSRKGRR